MSKRKIGAKGMAPAHLITHIDRAIRHDKAMDRLHRYLQGDSSQTKSLSRGKEMTPEMLPRNPRYIARQKRPDAWVLRGPGGIIFASTVAHTRTECWEFSFHLLLSKLLPELNSKYWKRWDASIAFAKRRGYVMVPARLSVME